MKCHGCGHELTVEGKVYRGDECPGCGRPMHCCLNCAFYDTRAYHECHEPQAEWVRDKEKGNFCEYFQPGARSGQGVQDHSRDARKRLDDLFRK